MPSPSRALRFALNFLRHPSMLGSVIPSSRFLVHDVMSQIDWEQARVVVEFGPGVGTITQEIVKRLHPEAILVAIELNPNFARFHVVHGSALNVRQVLQRMNLPSADCIISGIPFTNMRSSLRRSIAREAREALRPAGAFVVYQFTRTALPYLISNFASVRQGFQLWNIFPARIFYCTP